MSRRSLKSFSSEEQGTSYVSRESFSSTLKRKPDGALHNLVTWNY